MGAETNIHAALMDRAISLTTSPVMPKAFSGVASDVRDGDYLEIIHLPNEPVRTELESARPLDYFGFLQINIFRRVSAGSWDIMSKVIADQISAHFARGIRLTYSGTTVKVVKCWAGQGRKDPNGTHWQTPVFIEYVQIS
jgi:hypothetical protein